MLESTSAAPLPLVAQIWQPQRSETIAEASTVDRRSGDSGRSGWRRCSAVPTFTCAKSRRGSP
jgi:hypothetical protein